jgi:hypothetical protein
VDLLERMAAGRLRHGYRSSAAVGAAVPTCSRLASQVIVFVCANPPLGAEGAVLAPYVVGVGAVAPAARWTTGCSRSPSSTTPTC